MRRGPFGRGESKVTSRRDNAGLEREDGHIERVGNGVDARDFPGSFAKRI